MDSFFSRTNVVSAAAISFLALLGTRFFNRRSKSQQENNTMASSSSSSSLTPLSPRSSFPRNFKHHVFPSFHGADVRTNFLGHIVKEITRKGISLFIDDNIERSKSIGTELIEAINGSRIAIVLLSENYASSTWCLNELVEIMECRKEFGQTVIPLFYEVDPTDIKKQAGKFGKVFSKTCKGKRKEEIQRWKDALTEVAQVAGYHSTKGKSEAEIIEEIATDVSNKLNLSAPCSDFDSLVGMESHMTRMESLLQLDSGEVIKIGICGPPGIGKTTIARSLFSRHSQDFQLSVFIDNIKRKHARTACSDDYSLKLDLQKLLMSQLTNGPCASISHLGAVKNRLEDQKVLVILDDVDQLLQVEAMAKETSWFGPGSRIVVTTQDQRVLKASGIEDIYKVDLPSYDEAFQIFCMYAFGHNYPSDGFEKLACEVINLVGGLPLGLRVMGSYFRGRSKQEWIEALPRLRTHLDRDGEIEKILKFSYDALNDEDKSLFLHIACFFRSEKVDIVEGCLAKCFEDVTQGLRVLCEKSLIYIDFDKSINMAELLVQLGRKIVREEYASDPGKRKFFDEAFDIEELFIDDETGIDLYEDITGTSERAFEKWPNLQFLKLEKYVTYLRSINYVSPKLRVLIWEDFQMTCFPSSFNPKFLVKLQMKHSNLEKLWEGPKPLRYLKWMDLSFSRRLKELPDLTTATSLNELNLKECSSLVELPYSIGNAINLQKLGLNSCSNLVELPSSMRNLGRLWELKLEECSKLEVNLANINLESLCVLDLSGCSLLKIYDESSTEIQELDPWIGRISCLWHLNLSGMKKLVSLPQLPDSLKVLVAEDCESLERLDCSFRNPDIKLIFANCFKLNQEARDLIIQTPTKGYAVFPAEEVPMCFTHRSSRSSLTVKLNQLPVGKSTKFKACIISADDRTIMGYYKTLRCSITSGGNALTVFDKEVYRVCPGHLYTFEVEVETEELTSNELVFEFEFKTDNYKCEIKECGILQLPSDTELVREDDGRDKRLLLL